MIGLDGNRRDYFESIHDVRELFRVIVEQRKQRELNPRLSMLRRCAAHVVRRSCAHRSTGIEAQHRDTQARGGFPPAKGCPAT